MIKYIRKGGENMNQIKTGKFISELRHQKGLTQEELGRKLGVSNKTVSRWENGNYMPDIETLRLLAKEFSVSMEELLDGEPKTTEKAPKKPDSFTPKERADFWRRNWKRENKSWFIFWGIALCLFVIFGIFISYTGAWLFGYNRIIPCAAVLFIAGIISLALYLYFYNKMCIYVDNNAYKLNDE